MIKGVISAPKGIITGAFTILLTFIREIELTADAIHVETLEGDPLGHTKDNFAGSGKAYHILCYLPDARKGKSRISVPGFDVPPVIVEYDTIRTIIPTWGAPFKRKGKVELPLLLSEDIVGLRKKHFSISESMLSVLYGSGSEYQFVVSPSSTQTEFSVSVSGSVKKLNGLEAVIQKTVLEVDRGTLD